MRCTCKRIVLAIRNEIHMIEDGRLDTRVNPLKVLLHFYRNFRFTLNMAIVVSETTTRNYKHGGGVITWHILSMYMYLQVRIC